MGSKFLCIRSTPTEMQSISLISSAKLRGRRSLWHFGGGGTGQQPDRNACNSKLIESVAFYQRNHNRQPQYHCYGPRWLNFNPEFLRCSHCILWERGDHRECTRLFEWKCHCDLRTLGIHSAGRHQHHHSVWNVASLCLLRSTQSDHSRLQRANTLFASGGCGGDCQLNRQRRRSGYPRCVFCCLQSW